MEKTIIKKNISGFTLIEIIISIGIIGILAATAIISMGPARSEAKLEMAQKEASSEIALAKAYALQGKTQGGTTPCGYGVYFSGANYRIYYNSDTDCETVNTEASGSGKRKHSSSSHELDTKTFSTGITATGNADVYFTVPNARVHNSAGTLGSISFSLTDASNNSKRVSVSDSGLITAE